MKQYIVFYKDSKGVEVKEGLPVQAKDRFEAKFIAFDKYGIHLTSITRVL